MRNLNDFDLAQLATATTIAQIDYHPQLGSTNDRAIELLKNRDSRNNSTRLPLLVLAANQTAGRGQQQRTWLASTGSLTFTLCLTSSSNSFETNPLPSDHLTPLLAAVAVCRAVESVSSIRDLKIKWPNDVLLDNRKLAGILVEKVVANFDPLSRSVLVIGIGLNANNEVPEVLAATTTDPRTNLPISLRQHTGQLTDLTELLIQVVNGATEMHAQLPSQSTEIVRECCQRLSCLNQPTKLNLPNGKVLGGKCIGLGQWGELLIENENGTHSIVSGSIVDD